LNNDNIVNISQSGTYGEMGTGLGLSICKEFLSRHNGSILIESEVNEGTTVNIFLPILKNIVSIIDDECEIELKLNIQNTIDFNILKDSIILVVDDNSLIREHLRLIIEPYAKVVDACNGEDGILKAHEYIPDIIISDVAMPIVDGFSLCEILSKDIETSHIPIILLTAKTANIARIEGLQKGATDYITKPFIEQEILLKICNILNVRLNLQKHLQKIVQHSFIQENPIESIEPALDKINALIRQHYKNPKFSVEFLYNEMAMSSTTLHRKIKSVINSTPNEMINEYRLSQGLKLLRSTQLTISEVAYAVGFSDPKYFTTCFTKEFGISPTQYVKDGDA
jgi:YesN/AraC family two-component response regulator